MAVANISVAKKGPAPSAKRQKRSIPTLGFELESLQPILRKTLDLDSRIFPTGIPPDSIVEIRGPSGSGKTFLMTYLLARLLVVYPEKTAIFLDTNHHFNFGNLKSILSHFDPEITIDPNCLEGEKRKSDERFLTYVNRITHIRCFDSVNFLCAFGPESPIDTMLLTEPNLSIIFIDSIDFFSYAPTEDEDEQYPNLLKLVKKSVERTKTPVLCSMSDYFPFLQQQPVKKPPPVETETDTQSSSVAPITKPPLQSNIILDSNLFTLFLTLTPQPASNKLEDQYNYTSGANTSHSEIPVLTKNMPTMECIAHLRSKQSPKTAFFSPGLNHRVKFSIFSGMLYTSTA